MKPIILTSLILCSLGFGQSQTPGSITAITQDGREVILKPDKTWEFEVKSVDNKSNSTNDKSQETKKLQLPFAGDNDRLPELANSVASLKDRTEKSEFETEKQYRARIKELMAQTKLSNKPLAEFVFIASPDFRYYAESKEFFSTIWQDVYFRGYNLVLVQRECPIYGVSFYRYGDYMATLRFKMLPDEAKDKKQHLRVAVYGFPVATPEKYDYKHVYFIPTKFIVFNNLTGTIYEETSDEIFQSFCETP